MTRIVDFKRFIVVLSAMLVITGCIGITGCGGTGPSSGSGTPVKTTPTITWPTPTAITYGTVLGATQLDATASVAGTFIYAPAAGTTPTAGSQTLSTTFTPTDTADYNSATDSVTLTVNKVTPALTWPIPASITSATTLAGVLNASATANGSFAYTATLSGGTATAVTSSTTLAAGSYTLSVTFTPGDIVDYNSPAPLSVPLTVTQAPPTIAAIDKPSVYCEVSGLCNAQLTLTTTQTLASDTITILPAPGNAITATRMSATQIVVNIYFNYYTPGWYTFQVSRADGSSSSNVVATAFLAAQNTLAVSKAGELFQLDQAKTAGTNYVRKFKASGSVLTADGNWPLSLTYLPLGISYDDTTSTVNVQGAYYNANGVLIGGMSGMDQSKGATFGMAAKNGYAAVTQPATNSMFEYPISGYPNETPIAMGSQPSSIVVGTVVTETDAMILSRNGTVTLWRQSLSGSSPEGSVSLAGITPISTVQAANSTAGGWQVAYGETGPAAGIVAVLSTPDSYLVFVQAATMQETKSVTLGAGIWNQIASDNVHGTFILASANPQTASTSASTTTFVSVNPFTGVVTPLTSKSTLLASGFAVSADGNYLYICSRSACETQPNQ